MEKTIYNIRYAYVHSNEYNESAICTAKTNLFFDNQISAYDYIRNTLIPKYILDNKITDKKEERLIKENKVLLPVTNMYDHSMIKQQADLFTVHECILMGIPEPQQPVGYCYYKEHDMCGCM
jgi:hypothetical protein